MTLVLRSEAMAGGMVRYFTGLPCRHGHVAERTVGNRTCVLCNVRHSAKHLPKWSEKNPERHAEIMRRARAKFVAAHPERNAAQRRLRDKRWRAANPEKARQSNRAVQINRRARKKGAPGKHTRQQIAQMLIDQHFICAECPTSIRECYHVDHIVALAKGGSNDISNIQLLCPPCNLSKSDLDSAEWRSKRKGSLQ